MVTQADHRYPRKHKVVSLGFQAPPQPDGDFEPAADSPNIDDDPDMKELKAAFAEHRNSYIEEMKLAVLTFFDKRVTLTNTAVLAIENRGHRGHLLRREIWDDSCKLNDVFLFEDIAGQGIELEVHENKNANGSDGESEAESDDGGVDQPLPTDDEPVSMQLDPVSD